MCADKSTQLTGNLKRARHLLSPELISGKSKRFQSEKIIMEQEVGTMSVGHLLNLLMQNLSGMLDEKLELLATKKELQAVKEEVAQLKLENADLKKDIQQFTAQVNDCKLQMEESQKHMRKNNIVGRGLVPQDVSDATQFTAARVKEEISNLFKGVLGLGNIEIINTKIIHSQKIVIVELRYANAVYAVLGNSNRLKGTRICLSRDLTPNARRRRRKVVNLYGNLKKLNSAKTMLFKGERLVIDGKQFTVSTDGTRLLDRNGRDGITMISELFGQDCSKLWNDLEAVRVYREA